MSSEATDPYSNSQAANWAKFYRTQDSAKGLLYQARLRLALELLDAHRPAGVGPVADVGCGAGQLTMELVRRGLRVTALDFSANMLELTAHNLEASQLPTAGVKIVQADLNAFEFPPTAHDAVCALGCLEFLNDFPDAVRRTSRTLRPGGLFILSMPNLYSPLVWPERLARRLVNLLRPHRSLAHHAPVTYAGVKRVMRETGLEPVEVRFSFPATLVGDRAFPPLSLIRRMDAWRRYPMAAFFANTWVAAFQKSETVSKHGYPETLPGSAAR